MKKIIIIEIVMILLALLIIGQAHAKVSKYYKAGDLIDLKIYCLANSSVCTSGTACNITVDYQNGSHAVYNQPMTNNNQFVNYTLYSKITPLQNIDLGIYDVIAFCTFGTLQNYTSYQIEINNYGRDESGNGLILMLILLPAFTAMVILLIAGFVVPGKNKMQIGEDGNVILDINYGYYLKLFCFLMAYLSFWVVTFLSWKISQIMLSISGLSGILRLMYIIESIIIFPTVLVIVVLGFMKHMADGILSKEITRRLPPR